MSESVMKWYEASCKYPAEYPEGWDLEMQALRKRLVAEPKLWVWRLVDWAGDKQPYHLIWGKYGPCWQHDTRKDAFLSAFEEKKKLVCKVKGIEVFEQAFEEPAAVSIGLNKDGRKFVKISRE